MLFKTAIRTQEKFIEKHKAQPNASPCTSLASACSYNSTIHEEQVFCFFYKMLKKLHSQTCNISHMCYRGPARVNSDRRHGPKSGDSAQTK